MDRLDCGEGCVSSLNNKGETTGWKSVFKSFLSNLYIIRGRAKNCKFVRAINPLKWKTGEGGEIISIETLCPIWKTGFDEKYGGGVGIKSEPRLQRARTNSITKYNLHKSRNPSDPRSPRSVNFHCRSEGRGSLSLVWKSAQGIYHTGYRASCKIGCARSENESRRGTRYIETRPRPVNFRLPKAMPDAGQGHVGDTPSRSDDTLITDNRSASVTFVAGKMVNSIKVEIVISSCECLFSLLV